MAFLGDTEIDRGQVGLHCEATVMQAELVALREALSYINSRQLRQCAVLTDSMSALLKICHGNNKPTETVGKILETWRETRRHGVVSFHWVKAHVGIPGNERADELAKEAATGEVATWETLVARSAVKSRLRERTIQQWQQRWELATTGAWTRVFYPRVGVETRELTYETAQLVTGHGNFNKYLQRIARRRGGQCECRTGEGSGEHLLLGCGAREMERARCDTSLVRVGLRWPRTVEDITALATEEAWWEQLQVFAESVGRLAKNMPQDQEEDEEAEQQH